MTPGAHEDPTRLRITRTVATPPGTLVTVLHEGFTQVTDRGNNIAGWTSCLDRLTA